MRAFSATACLTLAALATLACGSNSSADSNDTTAGTTGNAGGAHTSSAGGNGAASSSGAGAAATGGASGSEGSIGGAANGGSANGGSANGGGASGASGGSAGLAGAGNAGSSGGGTTGVAGSTGSTTPFPANCTCLSLGPPACTQTGHVSFTLAKAASPNADQLSAYDAITCAMDGAIAYYNCNTSITKQLNVTYDPAAVPTADGNLNGSVRFGGRAYMECVTGMHEIAHAVGVGTAPKWSTYSVGGVFTGTTAIAQLRAITGSATDVLHSDTQHFWPYGLNYASEAHSTADLIDHCLMVTAIRKDLGLQ